MLDKSNINVKHVLLSFDYSNKMKLLKDRISRVKIETGWNNAELARQVKVSRTAPTDWLNGSVGDLSSAVAQRLSVKTKFNASWLATGDGPIYKDELGLSIDVDLDYKWPFNTITPQEYSCLKADIKEDIEDYIRFKMHRPEKQKKPKILAKNVG